MSLIRRTKSVADGIQRRSFVLLLCALTSAVLSGCSFLQPHADPTRFYVLTGPGASSELAGAGECKRWRVGLRPVEVPGYLQGKAMVVRSGVNEIQFADFDRWAEPLDQGISRVMKEMLSSMATVTLNSHGDDTLNYEVTIRLLACEGVRAEQGTGTIRFVVAWEVRSVGTAATVAKRGVFTAAPVAWDGKDYGQLAQRLSAAIAGAGQAVAAALPLAAQASDKITTEETTP